MWLKCHAALQAYVFVIDWDLGLPRLDLSRETADASGSTTGQPAGKNNGWGSVCRNVMACLKVGCRHPAPLCLTAPPPRPRPSIRSRTARTSSFPGVWAGPGQQSHRSRDRAPRLTYRPATRTPWRTRCLPAPPAGIAASLIGRAAAATAVLRGICPHALGPDGVRRRQALVGTRQELYARLPHPVRKRSWCFRAPSG